METTTSNRALACRGGMDIAGIALGYIPMAMAIGAAISRAPSSAIAGWIGAPLLASGTAHLTITNMLASGGRLGAAILAGFLINARLVAYSAGLAAWFGHERRRTRLLIGFFTIDATYLLADQRFRSDDPGAERRKWYFVGMGVVLWSIWSAAMAVGILVGGGLPGDVGLEWVATFMLIGLVALNLDDPTHRRSAVIGAAVAVAAGGLAPTLLPAIAAFVAVAVGVAAPSSRSEMETADEPQGVDDSGSHQGLIR